MISSYLGDIMMLLDLPVPRLPGAAELDEEDPRYFN
jgi:hypothetical protein